MTPADSQEIIFCISFKWESWGSEVGLTAAASLITFPTCFFGGQAITGVLMQMSAKVSQNVAKAVATTVGGLVGGGVHSGSYVLQCEVDGKPIEPLGLVLSGVGGIFEGTSAAYLGAKLVVTKFNPNKGIKTMKLSQDNHNVEVFKLSDETLEGPGPEFFPRRKVTITESQHEFLRRSSIRTGGTVDITRKSVWAFDNTVEKGVKALAEALDVDPKWVRISSKSLKAQNVLFRSEAKELLFLEHAGPQGYGAFLANQGQDFADMVKKLKIPGGQTPKTVTLLGCDVPQDFALDLQIALSKEFDHRVVVKTLPFADEGTLLQINPSKTWNYWKKVDPTKYRDQGSEIWDTILRTPKDKNKPFLDPKMPLIDFDDNFDKLQENTNFWVKMFNTFTSQELPDHAVPVNFFGSI